jgi:hypothetical protein
LPLLGQCIRQNSNEFKVHQVNEDNPWVDMGSGLK